MKNNPDKKDSMILQLAALDNTDELIEVKKGRQIYPMYYVIYSVDKTVWEGNEEQIKGAIWATFRNTVRPKRNILYFEAILGHEQGKPNPVLYFIMVLVEYSCPTEVTSNAFFNIAYSPTGVITANVVIGTSKKKLAGVVLKETQNLEITHILYNLTPHKDSEAKKSLRKILDLN